MLEKYQIGLENLPPRSSRDARRRFEGRLCRDFTKFGTTERLDKEGEDEFQRIDDEDEDSLNGSMKGDMEGETEVIEQDISTHTNLVSNVFNFIKTPRGAGYRAGSALVSHFRTGLLTSQ